MDEPGALRRRRPAFVAVRGGKRVGLSSGELSIVNRVLGLLDRRDSELDRVRGVDLGVLGLVPVLLDPEPVDLRANARDVVVPA
jgi:hypothetical protein